jgi:FKBP-type peptidyl-prolyl cis-trans isomerase
MMSLRPLLLLLLLPCTLALQQTRRAFFDSAAAAVVALGSTQAASAASTAPALTFSTAATSGIEWADAKVGTGPETKPGSIVAIDYVMSTTGARYGSKIYGTAGTGTPYRWKLGDGSTIAGLEEAILGNSEISPMRPGGIRRVVIPAKLAYTSLAASTACQGVGPIPPVPEAFADFRRFKNIYCNPNRAYQPDIVMDIKLYGKRTSD